ncbi:MAG: hypothetical protein COA62_15915 [Rhodobiaceae bacterium]|nr:MAG: hypothetical protein COA62_15915 [Rhodobiaceae bacterium]
MPRLNTRAKVYADGKFIGFGELTIQPYQREFYKSMRKGSRARFIRLFGFAMIINRHHRVESFLDKALSSAPGVVALGWPQSLRRIKDAVGRSCLVGQIEIFSAGKPRRLDVTFYNRSDYYTSQNWN